MQLENTEQGATGDAQKEHEKERQKRKRIACGVAFCIAVVALIVLLVIFLRPSTTSSTGPSACKAGYYKTAQGACARKLSVCFVVFSLCACFTWLFLQHAALFPGLMQPKQHACVRLVTGA